MRLFIFSLFGLIVLSSCNQASPETTQHLETIDSLQTVVVAVEEGLKPWQDSALSGKANDIKELYLFLDRNYPVKDDRSFWINKMNHTRRVWKSLGKFADKKGQLTEDIALSKTQLASLRKSIEDNKLNEKDQKNYMAIESRAANEIHQTFYYYEPEAKICLAIWDTLGYKMQAIKSDLDSLRVTSAEAN